MVSTLRVMTLNIGSLLEPHWDERRHEIVSWIDHLAPDVVCLQEVCERPDRPNTAEWLAGSADGQWYAGSGLHPLDPTMFGGTPQDGPIEFGSAVLSRWPIDEQHLLRLDTVGEGFASAFPWEAFHARTAGLDVVSTHLAAAPTDGHHRRRQVVQLDAWIRELRGAADDLDFSRPRTAMPAILCGDFNAEPDSDEIRYLRGFTDLDGGRTFWQDAWSTAGTGGAGLTQDWMLNDYAAGMNIHRKRIDYVFVGDTFLRPDGTGRVISAEVVCDTNRTGISASDHFGLLVEIQWPGRPS